MINISITDSETKHKMWVGLTETNMMAIQSQNNHEEVTEVAMTRQSASELIEALQILYRKM